MRLTALKPRLIEIKTSRLETPGREHAASRGYDRKWQKARYDFLCRNPFCVMCQIDNRATAATVVDHIIPHQGDKQLFWDQSNWQSLCKLHHDSHKQKQEHRDGFR